MDFDKLQDQFKRLHSLKRMSDAELRKEHHKVFIGTKWYVKIPKWMHRSVMERRLFYYYCALNYHYVDSHPLTKEFRRKAKHILSRAYINGITEEQHTKERMQDMSLFTVNSIEQMPIAEVDRYLASIGLFVEGTEADRREILWSWYNTPSKNTTIDGTKVRLVRKGTENNKFNLRDLILANPTLSWKQFVEKFGESMPTVSRNSYNVARCILRKAGYEIPQIDHTKAKNPAIIRGHYGQIRKNRPLNFLE